MDFNLAVMLTESARRTPDKTAVILDDVLISYAQLDGLADRVAANLTAQGIVPGDAVGLQLPNIPQFVIAHFGILKAGGVVVPMNVLLKAPEIAHQMEDSGARTLITFGGFVDEAAQGAAAAGITALYVVNVPGAPEATQGTRFEALLGGDEPGAQLALRQPGDPAVIIYTSGTTGVPKGAELSHFTLYMNADVPGRLFDFQAEDVVIVALPLFHVFGLSSILNICILLGGTMSLVPRFDPAAVLNIIQRDRATVFEGVPTMYFALLQAPELDSMTSRRCESASRVGHRSRPRSSTASSAGSGSPSSRGTGCPRRRQPPRLTSAPLSARCTASASRSGASASKSGTESSGRCRRARTTSGRSSSAG